MIVTKQEILALLKENSIDVAEACRIMAMSRTNFYYHLNKSIIDVAFIRKIEVACNIKIITDVKGNNSTQSGENKPDQFDRNNGKNEAGKNNSIGEHSRPQIGVQPKSQQYQGVPIYNMPASASDIEMYADSNDVKVIGVLGIPGATKSSFALPVHGHSMYPTLANGNIGVVRPIQERDDIEWGSVYYIEYGDYRVWKRLIKDEENTDNVVLWSDNQTELVGGRPKYAAKVIKADRINRLCLLTDILQKPNY